MPTQALEAYRYVSEVCCSDLALAEYGRIGRALLLYQLGAPREALLALEDEEAALRGAAEVRGR